MAKRRENFIITEDQKSQSCYNISLKALNSYKCALQNKIFVDIIDIIENDLAVSIPWKMESPLDYWPGLATQK